MSTAIALRQKRAALIEEMGQITALAGKDNRAFTADEQEKWNKMFAAEKLLRSTIEAVESQDGLTQSVEDNRERQMQEQRRADGAALNYDQAFSRYITAHRESDLTPEVRDMLRSGQRSPEQRDLGDGTGSLGGYLVPTGFRATLVEAMKFYGGMRASRATQFSTASGQQLQMPTDNDTSNVGAILGENTADTTLDDTFGQVTFQAYKYTSRIVKVSMELMNDSAFDLSAFLAKKLGIRIGRIQNTHFTSGTGTAQPQGVTIGATQGATGAVSGVLAYNDLINLKFSVDYGYRQNAQWMANDAIWEAILKIVDTTGRPLVLGVDVGISETAADRLLGQPFIVNNDMTSVMVSSPVATQKTVLYGDLSNYWIRDVQDVTLVRFNERFADQYQVGFAAIYRGDGRIVDAGTHPIKYLAQS